MMKYLYGGLILGAALGTLAFFNLTPFRAAIQQVVLGSTTQGSTGSTARQYNVYGVNLAAPGANATSTSILNPTGQDLYVTALKVGCENVGTSFTAYSGAGLAALTLKVATSSTAAPQSNGNTNLIGSPLTLATTTSTFVIASSTAAVPGTSQTNAIWAAATYMTFTTNATNTAVCTFGVDAFSA